MPDIFLSYSRADQAVARRFADAFAAEGLEVWWDVTLRSGEAYDEVTENALRAARAVVVLWSATSVASRWVRSEATLADRHHTLAPVTIEPCERPIMFELIPTADLCHWRGEREDSAWLAFVEDVRQLMACEAVAPTPVAQRPPARPRRGGAPSLAVLPFKNRSGL
ncbi:MAG TPA: toll/interleukin-1 receptor domain-containing protein, partial [Caulobacteraceae bacterium]|nr:toll/interleukin-1 receptor domain-containing protein [Caulobacteraceae bacterium]